MNKYLTKIETCPYENVFFASEKILMNNLPSTVEGSVVNIYDDVEYQEILGFGGSFTESSAYIYSLLSQVDKKRFLELYFSREKGIAYNFGRTHINSCDFSLGIYSYVTEGDITLDSFDFSREHEYIIPFLRDVIEYTSEEIILFASPWSPPAYMKDNKSMVGGGKLLEEYKSVWARYYAKYVKAMANEGIKISAITVQNEPKAKQTWESCFYSPQDELEFIDKYLIDALDDEGLSDIKIMIWDHNKERVYDRAKKILSNARVNNRVWAVAHHWYSGDHFDGLRLVHEKLNKPLICTEFCGPITEDANCLAEKYSIEICENLNNFDIASCDWNLLLNQNGGPYHNRCSKEKEETFEDKNLGCFAPILYDADNQELKITPIYYYIGHFSKYIERGAKRIATTKYNKFIYTTAFKNLSGEIVVIVINSSTDEQKARLRYNDECTEIILKPHSIITCKF